MERDVTLAEAEIFKTLIYFKYQDGEKLYIYFTGRLPKIKFSSCLLTVLQNER